RCCTPVPGDEMLGFVTRGSGVSVHRVDCPNVASLKREPERMVEVEWGEKTSGIYLVQIQVEALDRSGLLSDITKVLTDTHVNIRSASVGPSRARVAQAKCVFEMSDASHLDTVLSAVRKVEGVFDVYRISGGCAETASQSATWLRLAGASPIRSPSVPVDERAHLRDEGTARDRVEIEPEPVAQCFGNLVDDAAQSLRGLRRGSPEMRQEQIVERPLLG